MDTPQTNRELYVHLMSVAETHAVKGRTLEEYLRAFLNRCALLAERSVLTTDLFVAIVTDSFSDTAFPYDVDWERHYDDFDDEADGFEGLRASLIKQIVDLREMESNGQLDDGMNYFGIDSPRGNRWYNFSPIAYIECGLAGTFECRGNENTQKLVPIDWSDICHFTWAGQNYE